MRAAGESSISYRNGGISGSWRNLTQVVVETGTSACAQNTPPYALYSRKTGRALRGEIRGRKAWDPVGGRAESLILTGRCGKRRGKQGSRECAGGERVGRACREASISVLRCLWSHRAVMGV